MKTQKYRFRLSDAERAELLNIIDGSTHTKEQIKRANILLEMDWFYYFQSRLRPQDCVASRCEVSTTTVYKVSKQYKEKGLHAAVYRKVRSKPPSEPIATKEQEALIIDLARNAPPDGKKRWTLRMLEKKTMELGIVERISDTTIGRVLKKHQIDLKTSSGFNGSHNFVSVQGNHLD